MLEGFCFASILYAASETLESILALTHVLKYVIISGTNITRPKPDIKIIKHLKSHLRIALWSLIVSQKLFGKTRKWGHIFNMQKTNSFH